VQTKLISSTKYLSARQLRNVHALFYKLFWPRSTHFQMTPVLKPTSKHAIRTPRSILLRTGFLRKVTRQRSSTRKLVRLYVFSHCYLLFPELCQCKWKTGFPSYKVRSKLKPRVLLVVFTGSHRSWARGTCKNAFVQGGFYLPCSWKGMSRVFHICFC
jgi:hypothetical protein